MELNFNEKQIEILQKAEEIFCNKGIDGTSVRDLAKAAGINIAMVSYYFGSKQKLVEALFVWRLYNINLELKKTINNEELNPYEKLLHFLDTYMQRIMSNHAFHRIMVREYSKNDSFIFIDKVINDLKISNLQFINTAIEEGYDQQLFLRKVPAEAIVMSIIGPISYIILNEKTYMPLWNVDNFKDYKETIINKYFPYLLDALKAILQYNEK
ncbi:TetR/AcrR family transcriptional regulator [Faecalibacter rhinopitheci]|uniref:TetR/AcrR family transcriptional regulator n=1 Tax=Faecalibacter rhinopitheci TaxID=2779678 RepID=A0A8J7FP12_9FLAO|nr:TetR/AcrR family transcriptional regulator [Faecalibacter rhinopitheci]MBF0596654.1 TetR/AcrR family transcriptional regulator [Faecalibacter rhinopitheci]MBQ0147664.1 TetR/AcrR family transcriptional regulator [Candidatus Onthonaster equi]